MIIPNFISRRAMFAGLLLISILSVLVLELGSRVVVGACRAIYRQNLGWGMQAITHGFQYNRINPPAEAIPLIMDTSKKLVVCFGGSTTQGISGMDWQGDTYLPATSWCQFLQEKLGDQYYVLNLAKTSMMSNYHIQVTKQLEARHIKPYAAIWYAGINDAAILIESPRREHESGDFKAVMDDNPEIFSTHSAIPFGVKLDAVLERYCFTYHLMGKGIRSFRKPTEENVLNVRSDHVKIAEANYRANLAKFNAWANRSGARIVLCTEALPTKESDRTGGGTVYCRLRAPLTFINGVTRKYSHHSLNGNWQHQFIDTGEELEGLGRDQEIYLEDHVHFTPEGNKLIAEKIYREAFKQ
jgi:lysophospholipase L1-like esterase